MKIAWTIDDAPTIAPTRGVEADPSRMDRMRETLVQHGVRHCVAFVIGAHAEGHEGPLERWLGAGYELANHTWTHEAASVAGGDALLRSVERCDRLLDRLGAFADGSPRWFRFPYLDRGASAAERAAIEKGLADLGYRLAHATYDTFDHRFETPIGEARARGNEAHLERAKKRYIRGALASLWAVRRAAARHGLKNLPHIGYGHFGAVGDTCLADLLRSLRRFGVTFVSLESAAQAPAYEAFEADHARSGLVLADQPAIDEKILRRVVRFTDQRGWLAQREAGPLLPHLS